MVPKTGNRVRALGQGRVKVEGEVGEGEVGAPEAAVQAWHWLRPRDPFLQEALSPHLSAEP